MKAAVRSYHQIFSLFVSSFEATCRDIQDSQIGVLRIEEKIESLEESINFREFSLILLLVDFLVS